MGAALAKALGCPFVDADDLHPQTNKDKMPKGELLTDVDHAPWLVDVRRTALKIAESDSQDGTAGVVSCAAFKVLRGKLAELDLSVYPVVGRRGGHGDARLEGQNTASASHPATYSYGAIELNSESNPLSVPENEHEEGKEKLTTPRNAERRVPSSFTLGLGIVIAKYLPDDLLEGEPLGLDHACRTPRRDRDMPGYAR